MRKSLFCVAALALIGLAWNAEGAAPAKKKTAAKKSGARSTGTRAARKSPAQSATTTTASSTARKSAGTKRGAASTASRKGKKPVGPKITWRNRQTAPTPDRYREIQRALASKGYLSESDITGSWNQDSIAAMKKFQTEQNLEPSGKITAMSLIALGLGPKRDTTAAVKPPEPAQAPEQP